MKKYDKKFINEYEETIRNTLKYKELDEKTKEKIDAAGWKISFTIDDLNGFCNEIEGTVKWKIKDVVYLIVLIDWIFEATKFVHDIFGVDSSREIIEREKKAIAYFKYIRSIAVAHPLNTNRHTEYGGDGNWICADILSGTSDAVNLCVGLSEEVDGDFYLRKRNVSKESKYGWEGIHAEKLFKIVEICIEILNEMAKGNINENTNN